MRKFLGVILLLSLLMVTPAVGHTAPLTLDGFMGIPWGANAEQVKQGMAQNGFSLHNSEKWGILKQDVFENGSYAGYQVWAASAFLKYDTLYSTTLTIKGETGGGIDTIYSHLKTLLTEKYGNPEGESQSWANNRASTGVKVTTTNWLIPNAGKQPHEISLSKTPDWYIGKLKLGGVGVTYYNHTLEEELNNREKQNI